MNVDRVHAKPNTSVSHGTLRDLDLLESFLYELHYRMIGSEASFSLPECIKKNMDKLVLNGYACLRIFDDIYEPTEYDEINASELVEELSEALNYFAPAGYHFGAHPGDGSDFGYWEIEL